MRIRNVALVAAVTFLATAAFAANPRGTASAPVGGKAVTIDYGRPSLKGRSLDALMKQLPADRMWRAGENQVTTLESAGDLTIAGQKVAAGKYSLYVHAGEGGVWSLVLNKDLGVPLGKVWAQAPDNLKNEPWPHMGDYAQSIAAQEVVRAKMATAKAPENPVEMLTMSLEPKGQAAVLTLAWGTQAWSIDLQPAK